MAQASTTQGGWTGDRSIAGGFNPTLIAMVVSISSFMEVLDSSIANVALANISGSLAASYQEATWVLTSYLIANAIIIPLSSFLSRVIGRKRYYMISVALFTGSSFLCGIAPTLPLLIMARVLQGIGGGGLAPVVQSMLADTFPPERRGQAFALFGFTVILGPIIGPTIGGWLTDNYSWHWIFLINVPTGILSLLLVHAFVTETPVLIQERRRFLDGGISVDYIGIALLAVGLGFLQVTMDKGQELDWFGSTFICFTAAMAGAGLVLAVAWELMTPNPVIDLRLLGQRNFAIANLLFAIFGVIIFGSTQFIPQLLQEQLGYTATLAGYAMALGGLATAVVMPLAGFLSGKLPARLLLSIGLVISAFALWHMSWINLDMSFGGAATLRMYQAFGLPFLFVTLTSVAYVGLPGKKSGDASAILNLMRNVGGGIGISLIQWQLQARTQLNQSHLVERVSGAWHPYQASLQRTSQVFLDHGYGSRSAGQALGTISKQLQAQATMLSYLDVFMLLCWMTLASLPLVLLLRPPSATPQSAEPG